MKKFVAGAAGALIMSAGLVASVGTAAHADPYPGTVATSTKAKVPSKVREGKVALCAKVKAVGSNATPTGDITFQVSRIGGGFSYDKTVAYTGGKVCVTKRLDRGTYVLRASYSSAPKTVFNDSSGSKGFQVTSRRG
jgi:hypothetical protein